MLKRTLFFANPFRLSMKNRQLVVNQLDGGETVRTIPIEDIGFVILEHRQISVTLPLLDALARENAVVVICDEKKMPSSILTPLEGHTTQAETWREQIAMSLPTQKNLWKQTVEAKIANQVSLLDRLGKCGAILLPFQRNVKSGDTDNREGAAARLYWRELIGDGFVRSRDGDIPNALLNYGYTILRAAVARSLIGAGLNPGFGIFHHNRYDAFPLADDVMEPYRPFVDEIVYGLYTNGDVALTTETKSELLRLLTADVKIGGVTRPLQIALTYTSASLAKCVLGKQKTISYPSFDE